MENNQYIQKEQELIQIYCIGIYSLALLDEYGKLERRGALAKVYNTIKKKFDVFNKQLYNYEHKITNKISLKTVLFIEANRIAKIAWHETMKETLKTAICVDISIYSLYVHNKELYEKIYGIRAEEINKLRERNVEGTTLMSSKIARILTKKTEETIADVLKKTKRP